MSTRFATAELRAPIMWSLEGVSKESQRISEQLSEFWSRQRVLASSAWRDSLLDEISQISESCGQQGWDGYDAEPVTGESALRAAQLIGLLPNGIQAPTAVPEPSGDISLEWRTDNQKHFSLSVSGQSLVYAGIFGGSSRAYGEERFSCVLPPTVVEILTGYFAQV